MQIQNSLQQLHNSSRLVDFNCVRIDVRCSARLDVEFHFRPLQQRDALSSCSSTVLTFASMSFAFQSNPTTRQYQSLTNSPAPVLDNCIPRKKNKKIYKSKMKKWTNNPEVKAKPFAAGAKRFRRCSGESVLGSTANGTHGLRGGGACLAPRRHPGRLGSVVADLSVRQALITIIP